MADHKYFCGLHGYEPNNAPVNIYTPGEFADYHALLGFTPTGAFAHEKLKDQAGQWRAGGTPTWATDYPFIQEAKAAGYVTIGAWQFEDEDNLPWDFVNSEPDMDQFDAAAAACVSNFPDVDVWIFGNEREVHGIDSTEEFEAERAVWFGLEQRAGTIWKNAGKGWAAGADQAVAGFLQTLPERLNIYTTTPDYWVLHAYERGGFSARHIRDVRRTVEEITGEPQADRLVYTEIGMDFEPGATYGTKAWIRDRRARDWWEHVGRALRRERSFGCYFTMKAVMRPWDGITTDDTTKYIIEGMLDAVLNTEQNPQLSSSKPATAAATTYRYLREGPYANNAAGAAWQAAREYARSFPAYFTDWA
jgi:hypothetical protein